MYKTNHIICDRCRTIITSDFNFLEQTPHWEIITKERKGSEGHKIRFDFCSIECRIVYFKGRKYYRKKQELINAAMDRQLKGGN